MQVKCSYSSNDSVFTIGRIYDVHIVYGNGISDVGVALVLIDDCGDVWGFMPNYRGGEINGVHFTASFERY
ncbi:TPA: hypothetical protein ACX284_001798 [Escherichia coli]|nr:hypothetical protein [Escherichia coli]